MFEYIDSFGPWVEMLAFFVLGVAAGRRWARVKMEAQCAARSCDTIKTMRTERMKLAADKMSVERTFQFMRDRLAENRTKIHGLESVNGKLGKEIQHLTAQLPRPTRRLVA
jgi:hypothetical protein